MTRFDSTVAASASAASCGVPRCPTIAVSTSRYSGSAASAPQRREREPQDLAVVGRAAHAGHSTIRPWSGLLALLAAAVAARPAVATSAAARRGVHGLGRRDRARAGRAPRPVALPTGRGCRSAWPTRAATPTCRRRRVAHARGRAPLRAAQRPATREAALRLGYLVGAARRGAQRTAGHRRRAARRIERAAAGARRTPARASPRALARGQRAGGRGMKLRLYHHPDGARVAYREAGTRPRPRARALARCSATASSSRSSSTWATASASCCPTCRCTATARTARATPTRWTGWPR